MRTRPCDNWLQSHGELAIENYEKLLDLWKDGDKKLPARLDAQKRLSKLKRNM
ncbi:MAG: hypothetical protein IIB94_08515 [Candidatus Marinimicrobia bacterium]|nr:hypothetical protein [Candidatus Neomarinimicrobiota bacterium]